MIIYTLFIPTILVRSFSLSTIIYPLMSNLKKIKVIKCNLLSINNHFLVVETNIFDKNVKYLLKIDHKVISQCLRALLWLFIIILCVMLLKLNVQHCWLDVGDGDSITIKFMSNELWIIFFRTIGFYGLTEKGFVKVKKMILVE